MRPKPSDAKRMRCSKIANCRNPVVWLARVPLRVLGSFDERVLRWPAHALGMGLLPVCKDHK